MEKTLIELHKEQWKAYQLKRQFGLVVCGVRAGKTFLGAVWSQKKITEFPMGTGLIGAPTNKILQQATLEGFFKLFPEYRRYYKKQEGLIELPSGGKVYVRSTDEPLGLEGMTLDWAWLDEAGMMSRMVWVVIRARVSIAGGQVLITTTPYCYSNDTEIYTKDGWKNFDEIDKNSHILAVNELGEGKFEKPQEIIRQGYCGKMYEFKGHAVNFKVTPNHRVLYKNSENFYTKTAEHFYGLKKRHLSIPKSVYYSGDINKVKIAKKEIGIKEWSAFMGWFLSEGSVMGSKGGKVGTNGIYKIVICQNDNSWKKDLIRRDLEKLPFKFSEHKNSFHTTNKELWKYLSQFGNSHNKFIPREFNEWTLEAKKILLNRLILGDGTYRNDRHGEFVYYTSSERMTGTLQEFLMLMGIPAKISKRKNIGGYIRGRKIKNGIIYHITERKRKKAMVSEQKEVNYKGIVGCVSVSTGYILVRRNGEECISGNSMNWLYKEVYLPCLEGKDKDIEFFSWRSIDNPYFPKEFALKEKARMNPAEYAKRYEGKFVRLEGLVWNIDDSHIGKKEELENYLKYPERTICGVDWGYSGAAGILVLKIKDDKYYVSFEWKEQHRTDPEVIQKADEIWKRDLVQTFYPDPNTPDNIEQMRRMNMIVGEVNKDIPFGISKVEALFREHRLFILEDCGELLDEIAQYRYEIPKENRDTKEVPLKVNDHLCDCLRYAIIGNELGESLTYQEEKQEKQRIMENRNSRKDFELL